MSFWHADSDAHAAPPRGRLCSRALSLRPCPGCRHWLRAVCAFDRHGTTMASAFARHKANHDVICASAVGPPFRFALSVLSERKNEPERTRSRAQKLPPVSRPPRRWALGPIAKRRDLRPGPTRPTSVSGRQAGTASPIDLGKTWDPERSSTSSWIDDQVGGIKGSWRPSNWLIDGSGPSIVFRGCSHTPDRRYDDLQVGIDTQTSMMIGSDGEIKDRLSITM